MKRNLYDYETLEKPGVSVHPGISIKKESAVNEDVGQKIVLVIEDNPVNMQLALDLLEISGFQVLTAVDGEAGLSLLEKCSPDLVLLDIGLPGIDGYEVYKTIRSTPRLEGIKVVAVTAHAAKEEELKIRSLGFDDFIAKPIETKKFVLQIKAVLGMA